LIVVVDYGVGNLGSVVKALKYLKVPVKLSATREDIVQADGVILPGVGSFQAGMDNLKEKRLDSILVDIVATGKPLLGICLGLQLLFKNSEEAPGKEGLGILPGKVVKFKKEQVGKIPHMGWNTIQLEGESILFNNITKPYNIYFVHSYYVIPKNKDVSKGITEYGGRRFVSLIENENLWGIQGHPEKSSKTGLKLLSNFAKYCNK
jgi:glutamine amidotransferase